MGSSCSKGCNSSCIPKCITSELIDTDFEKTIRYENYFKDKILLALVVSIYDGDTFRASVKINNELVIINIRCIGYDSPEMKPPLDQARRDLEMRKALDAKNVFEKHLIRRSNHTIDRFIYIKIKGFDKYGRFLSEVYKPNYYITESYCGCYIKDNIKEIPDDCIFMNEWMVKNGYGKPYDGGKKESHV